MYHSREYPNHIQYVHRIPVIDFIATGHYEFRPKKTYMNFLFAFMWKLLMRYGYLKEYHEKVTSYTIKDIQSKDMHSAVLAAISTFEGCHDKHPKKIIMGSDEFAELTHNPKAMYHLTYNCGPFHRLNYAPDDHPGDTPRREIFGVEVEVLPWIKGWTVL